MRLIHEAADTGQAESQNTLGIMYATGFGVVRDPAEACRWFELAAARGLDGAEANLTRLAE